MNDIVIIAETGCDVCAAEAAELGVVLVPMHVAIGDKTIDDGEISGAEMLEECRQLGVLPRTSGCTPGDFAAVYDRIHGKRPEAQILIIAYSAVTTCSFESARTAAEGRDYVHMFDTAHVTIGQGLVVTETARHLAANPDISVEELRAWGEGLARRVRMGFIPGDLGYLRAGGRLSNAAFVGATLLRIKPVIEVVDGKLVATKKLRGSMEKAVVQLIDLLASQGDYDRDLVCFVRSCGLPESVQRAAEEHARELGFAHLRWYETGDVITSHCGPGSFGVAFAAAE
ncbi:DegV family protein [Paratractidigestivibacter sp.]|uniref:DegV family protein n=1 Tax=Paratractidigestivibacter sp. TaxID=2847316 RepID=UPI002ABD7CFF|nr:DegV family protein [Paratractidigestivibacter sp.]